MNIDEYGYHRKLLRKLLENKQIDEIQYCELEKDLSKINYKG